MIQCNIFNAIHGGTDRISKMKLMQVGVLPRLGVAVCLVGIIWLGIYSVVGV